MNKTITTMEARAWMEGLRLAALRHKRAAGDPRAPMRARPEQEEEFEKAESNLAAITFFLKLIEKEEHRKIRRKAVLTADALLDGFITFGLVSAAALGVAAIAALLHSPDPIIQATTIIGVGVALARAVTRK